MLANRKDTVETVGTNGDYQPVASAKVTAYDEGGVVKTGGTLVTSATLYSGHGFAIGDCFIVNNDTAKFRLISNVVGDVISMPAVTVATGDVLVNLGTDTAGGSGTPNYDGSTITIYSTPDTTTAITSPKSTVTATSSGVYEYWYVVNTPIWELVRTSAGTPVGVKINNANSGALTSSTSGGLSAVANGIARWSGTTGLILKNGYTGANSATITDAGDITAAGTHTFGTAGTTTTLAGALSVAQASTLTGDVSAPGANSLGTAGNTNTVNGNLTVTKNLVVSGTTHTIAGTSLTSTATTTTLGKTVTGDLSTSAGATPTITSTVGWGTGTFTIVTGGTANRFRISMVVSGGTPSSSNSIVVAFNTTFVGTGPVAVVALNTDATSHGVGTGLRWTTTTTGLTLVYLNTPGSFTYLFDVIVMG